MMSDSRLHKIKHHSKVRSLALSIKGLLGANIRNSTVQNHPDIYYKHIYFEKRLYEGIEWVAEMERTSKVRAANLLMANGLSHYMKEKLTEFIKSERERIPIRGKTRPRFSQLLIRYTRAHGMDITKLF